MIKFPLQNTDIPREYRFEPNNFWFTRASFDAIKDVSAQQVIFLQSFVRGFSYLRI
jgi:hypothetical protein